MHFDPAVSRRGFLGMSAGLLALSRLRALPAAAAATGELRMLSPRQARILTVLGDRITYTGEAVMPRFADTAALQTIDTALLQLPPDVPQQLSYALLLFEYGPPLFIGKPATFTGLPTRWQDVYLLGWSESRFHIRRIAFQAFKNLTMLGYYSQDATWPAIHYDGPWAPKPRRSVGQ